MNIYAVVNQKGGVGKTTTVLNLATAFAVIGKKTLIIDVDPQGNASTGMGISIKQRENHQLYNALAGEEDVNNFIIRTKIPKLDIVPAGIDLLGFEVEFINKENREFILKNVITQIKYNYDVIFLDCPPSLGLLTLNSLVAADKILIPVQCEFFALEGLSHILNSFQLVKNSINNKLEIEGIILTMYDSRNNLSNQVVKDVKKSIKYRVFKTIIPRNVKLSESPSFGVPAILHDRKCAGSIAYINLAKEIIANYQV